MDTKAKGFVMYEDYREYFSFLSREEKADLIDAIFGYGFEGEEAKGLSPIAALAFAFIRNQIDRDREKYEKKCETNRKNAVLGGRPHKAESPVEEKKVCEKEQPLVTEIEAVREPIFEKTAFLEAEAEEPSQPSYEYKEYEYKPEKKYESPEEKLFKKQVQEDYFNRFWRNYPKKADRSQAFEAFLRLSPDRALLSRMIESLEKQKKNPQWEKEDGRYIPYAKNWIEGRRWEDSPPPESPPAQSGGSSFVTDEFFEAAVRRSEEILRGL